jgi:hypothetical protein
MWMMTLNKQYCPQALAEQRKESEIVLTAAGASNLVVGREGTADERALETLDKRVSKPNMKISAAFRLLPVCTVFLCNVFLWQLGFQKFG